VENRIDLCLGGFLVADLVTDCAPTFSYMGEPMNLNFQLLAQDAGGSTTRNYVYSSTPEQNFAKLNLASNAALHLGAVNAPTGTPNYLTARLDTTSLIVANTVVGTFLVGAADITAPIAFSRASAAPLLDGPFATLNIGIAPLDSDGVAMGSAALDLATTSAAAGSDHALIDSTEVRHGRLRLQNSYGSELLDLPMSFNAQYWNGSAWSLNSLDTDTTTTLSFAAVGSSNITSNTCVIEAGNNSGKGCAAAPAVVSRAYLQGGVAGFAGNFNLWLKAPGTGHAGSIDITAVAPTWLKFNWAGTQANPTARATFGVFKSPLIYRRENY
jgi:MSHA biogenesis protein MshQ